MVTPQDEKMVVMLASNQGWHKVYVAKLGDVVLVKIEAEEQSVAF